MERTPTVILVSASLSDLAAATGWIRSAEQCRLWAGWRVAYPIDSATQPAVIGFTRHDAYSWSINGQLIAFGQIISKPPGRQHLARIIVNPGWRQRGYGETFVRALLARTSAKCVSLNVFAENAPAVALYRRLGFVDAVAPPSEYRSPQSQYMEWAPATSAGDRGAETPGD